MELQTQFNQILLLIKEARLQAYRAANQQLVHLYWQIGGYISHRTQTEDWGKNTVQQLAVFLQRSEPGVKGFSDKNLWRMKQFFETYRDTPILASTRRELHNTEKLASLRRLSGSGKKQPATPSQDTIPDLDNSLLTQLSWTHHRTIFGSCKTPEERAFYIRLSVQDRYSVRELERQLNSSVYERTMLSSQKLTPLVTHLSEPFSAPFKDRYIFEFLQLPRDHSENELQKAIIANLKQFLLEFSRDFAFVGEEVPLQVGSKDFELDLLFFNRAINCLVAIELKVVDFVPEHLGKLNFYLEALDRDVKKPHENPSIGLLLCKAKDDEVVEYTLSRQLSPAMVAEYQLHLPDKKLLQQKLHELFELNKPEEP